MIRTLLVLLLIIAAVCISTAASLPNQALIILGSDDFEEMRSTISALEKLGVSAHHVLPPFTVIANVPQGMDNAVLATPNVTAVYRGAAPIPAGSSEKISQGIQAWNNLVAPSPPLTDRSKRGMQLAGDTLTFPPVPETSDMKTGAAPGEYNTSDYMIGDVALGLILPESFHTGTENWTSARQQTIVNAVIEGMNWWISQGGPSSKLTFYYDLHLGVQCAYEPISMNEDYLWMNNTLGNMGYTQPEWYNRIRAYVNNIRNSLKTDWAFVMFVADSLNDPDGTFPNGLCAYACIGGPFTVLTWDNDGWGVGNFFRVAAHETGHIFRAADEYGSCGFGQNGYLGVENLNCENGNPNSVPCIMRGNDLVTCQWTPGQLGWRDSDGDGIYDPVDNDIIHVIDDQTLSGEDGNVSIKGSLSLVPWDSAYYDDVTVNKFMSVRYRVDEGSWIDALADDGSFDQDIEHYTITTTVGSGIHSIEIEAVTKYGNKSNIIQIVDPYPPVMGLVEDEGELAYDDTRLYARWNAEDEHSPITEYAYAIGTSPADPGSDYVKDWTAVDTPAVNAGGLSLTLGQTYYFYVKAKNSSGIWSNTAASDGIKVTSINPGGARQLPDYTWVGLKDQIVTGTFPGFFYVQDPDNTSGIRINAWSSTPIGSIVTVRGGLVTEGPERAIYPEDLDWGDSSSTPPVYLPNRSIGGYFYLSGAPFGFTDIYGTSSLYNTGLLVKTTGVVTYVDPSGKFGYIDDGSGLSDGNGLGESGKDIKGIRVIPADKVEMPGPGGHIAVVGVSSSEKLASGAYVRAIRPRQQSDFTMLNGGMIGGRIITYNRQSIEKVIESPHPYGTNYLNWYVNGPAGGIRMRLHFEKIELAAPYDVITIYKSYRYLLCSYSGPCMLIDQWTDWFPGVWAMIEIYGDTGGLYGFKIDRCEVEFPEAPVPGVTVTLSPGGRTTVTDENGRFYFDNLEPGTYTVTPSLNGAVFTPESKTIELNPMSFVGGMQFVATF